MAGPEFPEYAITYSKNARELRGDLEASLRATLMEIEDGLAEDPDKHPRRTIPLADDMFIYRHPKPALELTCKIDRERKVIYILHLVAPKLEVTKSVFISYSHEDEEWLLELKKWLKPLEQQDLIQIWDDTEIKASDDWNERIEDALGSAKAAVLLVSQDFLFSEFISENELPVLLDKAADEGLQIFWIAVSASTVEDTEIIRYQAANDPQKPLDDLDPAQQKKEFLKIYKKIKEAVAA